MKIWLINHYAVPTKYYPLARPAAFAKHLMNNGHEVIIFAASTVHNSDLNLITDGSLYKEDIVDGIHYVYVKAVAYQGNSKKRILNMLLFPQRLGRVCQNFAKPDVILSVSATPMACMKGISLAHKYGCKGVAEIADLWPESFVAYGLINPKNPILKLMYAYEKRLYKKADAIIFTMEGGKDYIIEKGWNKESGGPIDLAKVYHINNGVDLHEYYYNKSHHTFFDADLEAADTVKVVYTGSVRKVNDLGIMLEVAAILRNYKDKSISILIFGDGDERKPLENEAQRRGLKNIYFKGKVGKEYIPFILSKADLCLMHWQPSPITKFGMSMNKLFDYFASEKPILSNSISGYDLIQRYKVGKASLITSAEEYAQEIISLVQMPQAQYMETCENARLAAIEFDYSLLTEKLLEIMEK